MDIVSVSLASKANNRITELTGNGRLKIPGGDEASRPTLTADDLAIRYNTDTSGLETWNGTDWLDFGTGITAVALKGTDTEANILDMENMVAEDLWIASDTLNGWVYDGSTWINIGPLQGPQGLQGLQGNSITGITLTGTSDLVDTYTISYSDTTTDTIEVTNGLNGFTWLSGTEDPTDVGTDGDFYLNTSSSEVFTKTAGEWASQVNLTGNTGNGISSIARTAGDGSEGTTDTYTVTYTDESTTTFDILNGADGDMIDHLTRTEGTGAAGETDTYTIYGDADETQTLGTFDVYNGNDGDGSINDDTTTDTTLWSSNKINDEILAMSIALG